MPWLVSMACGVLLWMLAGAPLRLGAGIVAIALAVIAAASIPHLPLRPEVVMLTAGLCLVLVSAAAARDVSIAGSVRVGMLLSAAVTAAMGLVQYAGFAPSFAPWISHAEAGSAFGNLRQTNQYATLCWMGVALVIWAPPRVTAAGRIALVLLLAAGAAASVSRTGMLQAGVLFVLALLWRAPGRREPILLCGVAIAAYAAATVLLPQLLEALTGEVSMRTLWTRLGAADGCASRLVLWSNVLHLISLKPLAGWGWGELDYAHYTTLYDGARFCEILDNAHNLPLHLAVELGVPLALLVCGAFLLWAWRQRPWDEVDGSRQVAWAVIALVMLHSLLEYPLWYGPFQIAWGFCLGCLLPGQEATPARSRSLAGMAIGAGLLVGASYAAWDYTRVHQIYLPPQERRQPWAEDTLAHARRSWLFGGQARFAELTLATPSRENAGWMEPLAQEVLHYSPEPRVIERAVESATWLGHTEEAVLHLARYRAAFPRDYEAWRQSQRNPARPGAAVRPVDQPPAAAR